jgi:ATP-dependent helicase HrpA
LDEAHERSLNIDFLLGYLQGLLKRRPELKLIITSATIDTAAFSQAFNNAPVVEVSGRLWPVDIRYRPLELERKDARETAGHIEAAVRATEDALLESDDGDVLVFLPTERDIREAREWMEESLGRGTEVLGLYGRMPAAEQQRIFAPGLGAV